MTTEMIQSNGRGNGTTPLSSMPPAISGALLTDDQIDLLKSTICQGATHDELALFVAQCNRTGLDPFVRQIHAVKRWDSTARREVMSIQVGIDGLRLIADRTGNYAPGEPTLFDYDKSGFLLSATAFVKKWVRGEWHMVPGMARWEEYVQKTKEGQPTRMWQTLSHVMLAKCAEAQALRRAFPQETSGLYTHEEMAQAEAEPPPRPSSARPITSPRAETNKPLSTGPAAALPSGTERFDCEDCGKELTRAQATLSFTKLGRTLCPVHQRSPLPAPPQEETEQVPESGFAEPALLDVPADDDGVPSGFTA